MLTTTPPSSVLAWLVATTAAGGAPPVELLWVTQAVTLLVGLASGWFALRSKRGEVVDTRQARFDARVDRDLDEALAATVVLRRELDEALLRIARYEAYMIRAGIDPTTGRKDGDHGENSDR
jgi:hypothetical protein